MHRKWLRLRRHGKRADLPVVLRCAQLKLRVRGAKKVFKDRVWVGILENRDSQTV